ncbi:unnamed protein product, partial [marine sediment metagenome]
LTTASIVVKINTATFGRTGAITLSAGENTGLRSEIVGTDLYCLMAVSPAIVVKVDLTGFTRTGALSLSSGSGASMESNATDSILYVGTNESPAIIYEVELGGFTEDASVTFESGENSCQGLGYNGTLEQLYCHILAAGPAQSLQVSTGLAFDGAGTGDSLSTRLSARLFTTMASNLGWTIDKNGLTSTTSNWITVNITTELLNSKARYNITRIGTNDAHYADPGSPPLDFVDIPSELLINLNSWLASIDAATGKRF